ncbi:MAG: ComEA family DNA-binding protein [Flavisolibacter sp.]
MKNLIFLPLTFLFTISFSQEVPIKTEQQLEDLASSDTEVQDDQFLLQLNYFKKHPIDINTVNADELQSLFFLTDLQIIQLIHYRNILGKFLHMYELQSVPSWDLRTIETALPFLTISPVMTAKENFLSRWNGDQQVLFRLTRQIEKSKGFDTSLNTHFLGDRNHLYFRYTYQYKNLLYFGLTADKDAGENFFKGVQSKGFDFYGVHFFLRNLGSIKSLAVGDFTLNLGQGLIQWQSMGFGKGADVMMIKRQSPVLMPYRSAGEFNFNRGIGITLQKKKFEASLFTSYKKITANVKHDSLSYFTSINSSGYHRTEAETDDRNQVRHTSIGANISIRDAEYKIGVNTMVHNFDMPLHKTNEPYNLYAMNGKHFFNASLDYSYTLRNIHLFGEIAVDKKLHKAFTGGALLSVDAKIDLSVLYRNLQKEYTTLLGNAFTESSTPTNEKGLFAGISFRPKSRWLVNAYVDMFQFPWIKFGVNAPSAGQDYMLYISYRHNKKTNFYLRYRVKNKPSNGNTLAIYSPEDELKKVIRLHFSHELLRHVRMNYRLEYVLLNQGKQNEKGFMAYIESSMNLISKLYADFRIQFFHTDGYASRIYAYESDVMYGYSIPGNFDQGVRYYGNFRFDFGQQFSVGLKWSQSIFPNNTILGSGLNTVYGKNRSEIKVQLMMKLK